MIPHGNLSPVQKRFVDWLELAKRKKHGRQQFEAWDKAAEQRRQELQSTDPGLFEAAEAFLMIKTNPITGNVIVPIKPIDHIWKK